MADLQDQVITAAESAFLERCREDLDELLAPHDRGLALVSRPSAGGTLELEARVVVSGRPAAFSARGETLVEGYGRLRAAAPDERVAIAFRALVDGLGAR